MKYFLDTEFREEPGTIDLISIGIVNEEGKEYYALNKECNLRKIWNDDWLRDNVLIPIYNDEDSYYKKQNEFSFSVIKDIFSKNGKTIKEIRQEILDFTGQDSPEFYGYYSNYDWVVFCWIFGRMIDLPKSYPMYCKDLQHIIDYNNLSKEWEDKNCPQSDNEHNALSDAKWNLKLYKAIEKELANKKY